MIHSLDICRFAETLVGEKVVTGGDSPLVGFDCIGLLKYIIDEFNLPVNYRSKKVPGHYCPRDKKTVKNAFSFLFVKAEVLVPGTIILMDLINRQHAAIYVGESKIVHAGESIVIKERIKMRHINQRFHPYFLPGVSY